MKIRPFSPMDAQFCFKVRSNAFIQKFYGELTPEEVAAAVNAFMPNDYIRMAAEMPFFIAEQGGTPVGFFMLKRKDTSTAELPLVYIDLESLGQEIGSDCIDYIERWLSSNWREVNTVIPKYNGGFYKKVGFVPSEDTFCEFGGRKVNALRLVKKINVSGLYRPLKGGINENCYHGGRWGRRLLWGLARSQRA